MEPQDLSFCSVESIKSHSQPTIGTNEITFQLLNFRFNPRRVVKINSNDNNRIKNIASLLSALSVALRWIVCTWLIEVIVLRRAVERKSIWRHEILVLFWASISQPSTSSYLLRCYSLASAVWSRLSGGSRGDASPSPA